MAIYHCSISNVSRTKGSSSCATLSYISGEPVREERTAQTFSYGRSERVLAVETVLPEYAPEQYKDPAVLFNSIENYEKSENARTAKKVEVALPREFDLKRQKEVVREYIRENLTKEGYCATFAIHNDKNNNNPHAHILVANRQLDEKGEWNLKSRKEYALDENGERIPLLDKDGNQKLGKRNEKLWKRVSVQVNLLDKREFLQQLREEWAKECNRYLAQDHQIDHRSYEDQGIERIPTIHEGYAAREIERRGEISERCEENREIAQHNNLLQQIQNTLKELQERLRELLGLREKEKVRSTYETAKYYAVQELRRSTFDRVFEPMEIKYEFAERKRELIDEHLKMLNDKIFKGVPLPEKYYEIEKELDRYNKIENEMKAMVRDITDNMERGITDDEFLMESALKAAKEPKSRTKSRERSREDPDLSR